MVSALTILDRKIIDAGNAQAHEAVFGEFPILVAIAAKPITAVVVPLVGDLGAEVIKIEPPGGERNRTVGPFLDDVLIRTAACPSGTTIRPNAASPSIWKP